MGVRTRRPRRPKPGHTLTDQLPESGFPSGVSTPSITVLVLLLLHAGLCAVLLDGRESGTVSAAIAESQEQLVRGAGSAIGASASQGIADLRAVTAVPAATPEELLTRLLRDGKWRGAAVLDARTRALVAARGEPVSVPSLPATVTSTTVTPVVGADGALRMVVAEALPGARLLVAARGSQLPDATIGRDLRETLLLTTSTGQVVDARGAQAPQCGAVGSGAFAQPLQQMRIAAPGRDGALGVQRNAAAAPPRPGRKVFLPLLTRQRADALDERHEAANRRAFRLRAAQPLPLIEDEAEIDRLRDQQRQRHDQSDLADQALGQQPRAPSWRNRAQSFLTSAASM
jgi:hypothetical protein